MDRTERFYRIENLIRSRGCVSFAVLLEELGVSRATLKRDLEYLRSRLDAPIVYDRHDNGYRLQADPRDARQARHELPGLWFSEPEIHALLTMHQLVHGLDEGGVLARQLQPLLVKLQSLLGAGGGDARSLMQRVRIVGAARRPVVSRHFELIGSALTRRLRVRMTYWVRSRREETQRTVSPQRLVHHRNTWYLDAWCHDSDALRRFALDAIRGAELLDDAPADEVPVADIEAALDAAYGVFGGDRLQWAVLEFDAEAAQWVAHEQWHPQQQATLAADGRLVLRVPYADATELAMDVLRHGEQVKVLEPPALARLVHERLARAAARYERPR